jgi:hypothetical protein
MEEVMRHLSIAILITLIVFATAPANLLADEPTHSCPKVEKSCCKEQADCCKTADAECCKTAKACCDDKNCCTTAADGTHQCSMKHADGKCCGSDCCKDKSCAPKKTP